jgi:hypothetical protein
MSHILPALRGDKSLQDDKEGKNGVQTRLQNKVSPEAKKMSDG